MRKPLSLRVGDREFLLANWAKITGIRFSTLYSRLISGWAPEEIIGEKQRLRGPLKPHDAASVPIDRENNLHKPVELQVITKTVTAEVIDDEAMGQAARQIRRLAGLSLQQAADSLGWNFSSLARKECGTLKWKQKHIDKFNQVSKGWVNVTGGRTTDVNDTAGCQ